MKYTNKFNLPDTIVRAAYVNNDKYNKGDVHRSVTQLIQPPRIDMLRKAHFVDMEKDISEEWWALFGSAVHHILEMGASTPTLVEERLACEIDGWKVSGMIDLQEITIDGLVLSDYKVTTAFALMQEEVKPEWINQLNLLAYLVHCNKPEFRIAALQIVAIVRDWQRTQAAMDAMYPVAPVVRLKVPLWSVKRQENYLRERVRLHRETEMLHEIGVPLPYCSDEERWMRDSKWAVIKEGSKKAARVFFNEAEAKEHLKERKNGYKVEFRPGKSVRCDGDYCGVAKWCEQWRHMKEHDNDQAEQGGAG